MKLAVLLVFTLSAVSFAYSVPQASADVVTFAPATQDVQLGALVAGTFNNCVQDVEGTVCRYGAAPDGGAGTTQDVMILPDSDPNLDWNGLTLVAQATDAISQAFRSSNKPAALYDATDDKTYVAYMCGPGSGDNTPDACVTYFDHSARTWATPVIAGTGALTNDDHGHASMVMGAGDGKIHIFFDSHDTQLQHRVMVTADDISSWTDGTDPPGTDQTYPNSAITTDVAPWDGDMWIFYRRTIVAGQHATIAFVNSTDDGATWSSVQTAADFGTPHTLYIGDIKFDGIDRMHFTFRDFFHTVPRVEQAHHAYLNMTNSASSLDLYCIDGTSLGVSIDQTEADGTGCLVEDNSDASGVSTIGDIMMELRSTGNPIIMYPNRFDTGGDPRYNFTEWTGSAWSGAVSVEWSDSTNLNGDMHLISDTSAIAYLTNNGTSDAVEGGDAVRYTWDGSTWTLHSTTRTQTAEGGQGFMHSKLADPMHPTRDVEGFIGGIDRLDWNTNVNMYGANSTGLMSKTGCPADEHDKCISEGPNHDSDNSYVFETVCPLPSCPERVTLEDCPVQCDTANITITTVVGWAYGKFIAGANDDPGLQLEVVDSDASEAGDDNECVSTAHTLTVAYVNYTTSAGSWSEANCPLTPAGVDAIRLDVEQNAILTDEARVTSAGATVTVEQPNYRARLIYDYIELPASPEAMTMRLRAAVTTDTETFDVEFWDWIATSWVDLDTISGSTLADYSIALNVGRFISSSGALRMRLVDTTTSLDSVQEMLDVDSAILSVSTLDVKPDSGQDNDGLSKFFDCTYVWYARSYECTTSFNAPAIEDVSFAWYLKRNNTGNWLVSGIEGRTVTLEVRPWDVGVGQTVHNTAVQLTFLSKVDGSVRTSTVEFDLESDDKLWIIVYISLIMFLFAVFVGYAVRTRVRSKGQMPTVPKHFKEMAVRTEEFPRGWTSYRLRSSDRGFVRFMSKRISPSLIQVVGVKGNGKLVNHTIRERMEDGGLFA